MTIHDLILQTEDLKQAIAKNFDESLASRSAETKVLVAREEKEKLDAEISKLELFTILTADSPILNSLSHEEGVFESALGVNQTQATQILKLIDYFKANPTKTPELKSEPVVSLEVLRLVARCSAIAERFEASRGVLLAAALAGEAI